jgi:hypothetical protein
VFSDLSPCKYTIGVSYEGEVEIEWSLYVEDQDIVDRIMEHANENLKVELEYIDPSVSLEWTVY